MSFVYERLSESLRSPDEFQKIVLSIKKTSVNKSSCLLWTELSSCMEREYSLQTEDLLCRQRICSAERGPSLQTEDFLCEQRIFFAEREPHLWTENPICRQKTSFANEGPLYRQRISSVDRRNGKPLLCTEVIFCWKVRGKHYNYCLQDNRY